MNNDQRLIPFLGGLVIGGAAGSQTGRYPINNQYPAYYQQPYYGTPYYAYPNQYAQQVPITSTYYTYNDYQGSNIPLAENEVVYQQRSISDLSFVPLYKAKD